jgi:predicted nucleotide-binding protein
MEQATMSLTVIDQEFVVHLFAPLGGPRPAQAYQQVRRIWMACQETLEMTESIPGLRVPAGLPAGFDELPAGDVLAGQENSIADRQGVMRRVHDVLNLSVAMAQPIPEGLDSKPSGQLIPVRPARQPAQRRLGWADFGQIWSQMGTLEPDVLLGEARLFLARMPPGHHGPVGATAELGQSLDALLPYRADRPREWWRWGITTTAGYAIWDTGLAADTSAIREIILVAAADQDSELSAWAWSNGTVDFPPFARYLMHAAKLRYEARLLDSWHSQRPTGDAGELIAELSVALAPEDDRPGNAGLLRSLINRLHNEEFRLKNLTAELARLARTVAIAESNLAELPDSASGGGMFAADQALARWMATQVEDDLGYLKIDLNQVKNVRIFAMEGLTRSQADRPERPDSATHDSADAVPRADQSPRALPDTTRRVFVVHGRDGLLTERIKDLLRVVGLKPLEWEELVRASGSTAPYLGQVVAKAPHLAQATLVLLSPDDIVELHPDLHQANDLPHERSRAGQARPNVLFELGLALMAYPDRTIVVDVGQMRPIADLAGLNVIRFDGSAAAVKKLLDRLKQAECPVDYSGTDWLNLSRFADLPAYRRGPGPCPG